MNLRLCIAVLQHHFGLRKPPIEERLLANKQHSGIGYLVTHNEMQVTQRLLVIQRLKRRVLLFLGIFLFHFIDGLRIQVFECRFITELLREVRLLLLKNRQKNLVIHWQQILTNPHQCDIFKLIRLANRP